MRISARHIQQAVAADFGVDLNHILSADRSRPVARARQVAYFLSRELTPLSFTVLGQLFDRDHSTLVYGVSAVESRISKDRSLALKIEARKLLLQCEPQKVVDAKTLAKLGFSNTDTRNDAQPIHRPASLADLQCVAA